MAVVWVAQRTTILLVEQNARQALQISHRASVMEVGWIVLAGTARELQEHEVPQQAYFGMQSRETKGIG